MMAEYDVMRSLRTGESGELIRAADLFLQYKGFDVREWGSDSNKKKMSLHFAQNTQTLPLITLIYTDRNKSSPRGTETRRRAKRKTCRGFARMIADHENANFKFSGSTAGF